MRKTKILFVITRATKCGPIQVIENILEYIDKEKYELFLISIEKEIQERSILESFKQYFERYQYIPVSKTEALLGRFKQLRNAIEEINPDVVHSNGIVPDLIINRICPEKQLMIAHANYHIDYTYLFGKMKGEILARLHIRLMKKARMCIACSESLSQVYKKDGLNLPYIRNGVQVDPLDNYDKDKIRKELNLPVDKTIFIYAASFNPRKNQEFLVKYFTEHATKNVLLLLGDGSTFENLKEKYSNSNVIFAGRKANVKPYLQASDYFISSSLQEGMPMGVLEGMSEGLPVILSNIDQHQELFRVNNEIGLLFDNNSNESLKNALNSIKQLDYNKLSKNAYQTVLDNFNAKRMSLEYQYKYDEVVNSNR